MVDGTEVKSCNKIDQADKCKQCGRRVMRIQDKCPYCGSSSIDRKDDSKWLFSVRDEEELNQYLSMDRIFLLLMDYPEFDNGNFSVLRLSSFEIYPKEERMNVFVELLKNHYYNIYRPKADRGEKTNPMNFHPFSFQFYKCNPIKTFECIINDSGCETDLCITTFVSSTEERGYNLPSMDMPANLLKPVEWQHLLDNVDYEHDILPRLVAPMSESDFKSLNSKKKQQALSVLDEHLKSFIPLREVVSIRQKEHYRRS